MKIAFLGDTALFGKNTTSNSKYHKRFETIRELLQQCDYVVANLESPLTSQTRTVGGKSAYLKGNTSDVELLKFLNITHVTLANNHMYDYRAQGMMDTIQVLEKNNIEWYGVDSKSTVIEGDNSSIILMGYCCYSTNGKGLGVKKSYVNVLDPIIIEKELIEAEKKNMLPILSLHWGQEHVHYPNYDHIELARKLCKARKILIHGHHPHVIQGIEEVGESVIAYSLGNFCFDDVYTKKSTSPLVKLSKDNQESFVMIVDISNNTINNYKIIPFSFEGEVYEIENSIMDKIVEWSNFLNVPSDEYVRKRSRDLTTYINKRKKLRNLEWYLKRLNLESIKMIVGSKKNLEKYNQLIKKYISQ
ncbi:CapA family protein [Roseburia hominis]